MPTNTYWNPSFSVGHEMLDSQHQWLLGLCNDLTDCMASSKDHPLESDSRFHEILNQMLQYAKQHFATEEAILRQCGYPSLDIHKIEHDEYLERVTYIMTQAAEGRLDKTGALMFLAKWWTDHILVSDMQYSSYME
jgi:hemerythrin